MINYISIDEVLAVHDRVISETGGKKGILDFTLLHSAVERSKVSFGGTDLYPTIFEKAAALLHSLILNHPFKDSNKRTALVSTVRFLYLNGYIIKLPKKETIAFILNIEDKKLFFEDIVFWLKKHSRKKREKR